MKSTIYKITSLFLAMLVLLSTLSFVVDMHFCGNKLVDISVFSHSQKCGMEQNQTGTSESCSITKKRCCNDKQLVVKGQENIQNTDFHSDFSFELQKLVFSYVYSYIYLFEGTDKNVVSHRVLPTLFIVKPIYKIIETYLI